MIMISPRDDMLLMHHTGAVPQVSGKGKEKFTLVTILTQIMHILFVTFFNLFVFHLHVDVVGPLLWNSSLLLVLTTN